MGGHKAPAKSTTFDLRRRAGGDLGTRRASPPPRMRGAAAKAFSLAIAVTAVSGGVAAAVVAGNAAAEPDTASRALVASEELLTAATDPDFDRLGRSDRVVVSRSAIRTSATPVPSVTPSMVRARARALERLAAANQRRENVLAERAVEAEQKRVARLQSWVRPLSAYEITATFGEASSLWSTTHTGIDLAAPTGTPAGSASSGTVLAAGYDGSYGNKVIVEHADGTQTWYAHMDTINVGEGQVVKPGEVLGTVGATGNVTGPHLHLEVRPGGASPVDPAAEFAGRGLPL